MSRFNKMIELTPAEEPLAGVDIGRGFYFISYPDYVPGETATSPSGCCCSCGCKKELTNGLCLKCAEVEKLMGECFDKTGKVDLSGHVGQRDEAFNVRLGTNANPHIDLSAIPLIQFTNPLPGITIRATLVVPSCFPLEDYIFPFRTLSDLGLLQRGLDCRTFTFEGEKYTVRSIDFDDQLIIATRNS